MKTGYCAGSSKQHPQNSYAKERLYFANKHFIWYNENFQWKQEEISSLCLGEYWKTSLCVIEASAVPSCLGGVIG